MAEQDQQLAPVLGTMAEQATLARSDKAPIDAANAAPKASPLPFSLEYLEGRNGYPDVMLYGIKGAHTPGDLFRSVAAFDPDLIRMLAAAQTGDGPWLTLEKFEELAAEIQSEKDAKNAAEAKRRAEENVLNDADRAWLAKAAIAEEQQAGVIRIRHARNLPPEFARWWQHTPAYCFEWRSFSGVILNQLRPDKPPKDSKGKGAKYLFPKDATNVLAVPPGYQELVGNVEIPLVVVEGTKQHLAAASALAGSSNPYAVVGLSGCSGWKKDGSPIPCLHQIPLEGRRVYLAFDADVRTNRTVWDAATALAASLTTEFLVEQVLFVLSTRSGKEGLDDLLAGHPEDKRQKILLKLIETANPDKLPGKAPRKPPERIATAQRFFDPQTGRFLPTAMWRYLVDLHPMAITREVSTEKAMKGAVAVYEGGVYRNGESRRFQLSISRALGDEFALGYTDLVTHIALNELTDDGRVIPDRMSRVLVNCRNGLVDVMTGELLPHNPEVLTMFQVPVAYDPNAICPKYEAWLEERLPGQAAALEDISCQVLDRTRTPQQFLFLFGPKRSGKSTFLRILIALVGQSNTSAVTLHQLADDRFASANLYGKVLNVAADLSSSDVKSLAALKGLTGEDLINANRKYGAQFTFQNQALLAFSANEIPAVSDPSGAYAARAVPFHFANSFVGRENPALELELMEELPGILNRLIRALKAHRERGSYLGADAATREAFDRQSNRVKEFLDEMTRPTVKPKGTPRSDLWIAWKEWAYANGYLAGGRNKFLEKVRKLEVEEFKPKGGSESFALQVIDPETYEEPVGGFGIGERPLPEGEPSKLPTDQGLSQGEGLSPLGEAPVGSFESGRQFCPTPPMGICTPGSEGVCISLGQGASKLPTGVKTADHLIFDLETGSASDLFAPGAEGFVRLVGYTDAGGAIVTATDPAAVLAHRGALVAHNGFGFDFLALARHHGFDLLRAGEEGRLIDTMVLASLALPPTGGDGQKALKGWGLDALGQTLLGLPKFGDAAAMAKKHGGFDKIPVDDPDYVEYCRQDVAIARGLLNHFAPGGQLTPYQAREMRLTARLAAGITLTGFRVNVDLVHERIAEGQRAKDEGHQWLVETYGLPTTTVGGKAAKNPVATQAGKECIAAAFRDMGVTLPSTEKGGISTSNETMEALIKSPDSSPDVVRLADTVQRLNAVRSVYPMVLDHLQGDRIHPQLFACQLNGRFSLRPGMTTFGKRGERLGERAIFLPDSDDHVLIAADLSQIDARAVAAHCQDPAYMDLFEIDPVTGKPRDIHTEVALAIWGDAARRSDAKPINHGINYGMSADRLADVTGQSYEDAVHVFQTFFRKFPRLKAWQDCVRQKGKTCVPLSNGFGREMRVNPDRAHTQAPALVGCGCARDLMADGILRLPLELVPMLRMFVHDELVFSVPKADVAEIEAAIMEALQFEWAPYEGARPIRVLADLGARGRNWAEVYAKD